MSSTALAGEIVVDEPAYASEFAIDLPRFQEQQRRAEFSRMLLQAHLADDEWMARQWDKAEDAWLRQKFQRSTSQATQRNYHQVVQRWKDYVATQRNAEGFPLKLWQVEAIHVRTWQETLATGGRVDAAVADKRGAGVAPATVNFYLSCVSSFYSFVIAEKVMVGGVEGSLFADALGHPRANPFKHGNVLRLKTGDYERADVLTPADLGALMRYLASRQHTVAGARNYALIVTYLLTGYRNAEAVRMQWKHLRPHKQLREAIVYAWVGKGGKAEEEQIPDDAWSAIVHYLKLDGRWVPGAPLAEQPLQPDDYIFRPLPVATMGQLRNVAARIPTPGDNNPLSATSVLRVLRTALRRAGVPGAERFRIHDLRHTFAGMMQEDGATESEIMVRLHHASLETTGRYLKTLHKKRVDKVDTRGRRLYQQLMAFSDQYPDQE